MILICPTDLQLGNQLNLFSSCIAFAAEYGHRVCYPEFQANTACFEGASPDVWCSYPARKGVLPHVQRVRRETWRISVNLGAFGKAARKRRWKIPGVRFLIQGLDANEDCRFLLDSEQHRDLRSPGQLIVLNGYEFRAFESRKKHAALIRQIFTPVTKHREAVGRCIAAARSRCDLLVGVHIRLGDYRNFRGGQWCFEMETYRRNMEQMQAMFPERRVGFLVCSNETQSAETFGNLITMFGPGDRIEDMYTLAECDYIIGAPSSFSAWAALYGDKPLQWIQSHDYLVDRDEFVPGIDWTY